MSKKQEYRIVSGKRVPVSAKVKSKWRESVTRWSSVGHEEMLSDVLITRITRKPPAYRLEYVRDDGKVMAAMLVKAPKGEKGYDVVLDGQGAGFRAHTRRKAITAFGEMHKTLEQAAPISEEEG